MPLQLVLQDKREDGAEPQFKAELQVACSLPLLRVSTNYCVWLEASEVGELFTAAELGEMSRSLKSLYVLFPLPGNLSLIPKPVIFQDSD